MNDTISRQAVLEELQACVDTESMYDENNGLTYICYEDAVRWVEDLPPVKPTHGTCRDCEYYRRIELNSCDEVVATCKKHTDRNYQYVSPNFYCADYEKRGNEND
jgi:hypothetical protein